jgi:hypothetical protein
METAGSRNLRAVEPKAGHELTFKLDHSVGAAQYVLPTGQEDAPYGFGGLFSSEDLAEAMRHYLESPITIYLGTEDTDNNSADLTQNDQAMRQGENRRNRGEYVFRMAASTAANNHWEFGSTLVYAQGVGHSALGMLEAPEALSAFGLAGPQRR